MEQIGYSLVHAGAEVQYWGDIAGQCAGAPSMLNLPNGDQVHCAPVGGTFSGYKLVTRFLDYAGVIGIVYDGDKVIVTRAPPLPAISAPPIIAAALGMSVVDGDIPGIAGPFNILAAAYADIGQYWIFFAQSQSDTNYYADISGDAPVIAMTYRSEDYCVIEVKDAIGGNYVDPTTLNIKIYRNS